MKKGFVAAAMLAATALGSASGTAQTVNHRAMGAEGLLQEYSTINGGWNVNQRCNQLSRAERREMEWSIYNINTALGRTLIPDLLEQINKATLAIDKEPSLATCGQATRDIIRKALEKAREKTLTLTKQEYDPETSYNQFVSVRLFAYNVGMHVDQRCQHLNDDQRAAINTAYDDAQDSILGLVGESYLQTLQKRSAKVANSRLYKDCGDGTIQAVQSGTTNLQQLLFSIKQDESLSE